jgi:exonuclease SbcD
MKILHTSDWHLNERLGRIERRTDIAERLIEISGYLDQYKVDVMVVSGDLFANITRMEAVRDAVGDVGHAFKRFLLNGGTIVGISGNHDNEPLFNLFREMMDLVAPLDSGGEAVKPAGRMYLYEGPGYMRLKDRTDQVVQFVLLPFPTPSRYFHGQRAQYGSLEEKNRSLRNALKTTLETIQNNHIDKRLPAVMVSHIHVRGGQVHNLFHISETEDVIFEVGDIPSAWAYVACGHIHKPQKIEGMDRVCYAGSVERLDYGEAKDQKSVWLTEVLADTSRQSTPIALPLNATPLYRLLVNDPETDLAGLEERYPDAQRAIVSYTVNYKPGEHNLGAITEQIERVFPRWSDRQTHAIGSQVEPIVARHAGNLEDIPGTVRTFLASKFGSHPDKDDLLVLADKLLINEEDVE